MNFDIKRLTDDTSLPASIAKLQFEFWGPLTGHDSAEKYEQFLRGAARSAGLPTVLVAMHGETFLGSVNLMASEMTTRRTLSPWMAQLFVISSERGRGVGDALVSASIDRAAELGFRRTYLYTSGTLPNYYASRGWRPIEEVEYLGKMRTIMTFELP
jgi:predicted N-acetyltransferase YhbS